MVKIQLIVGTHPTESFSTRVAQDVARVLKKKGVQVVVSKYPFDKTQLGIVLSKNQRIVGNEAFLHERGVTNELIVKEKADYILNFHSSPKSELWENYFEPKCFDFQIGRVPQPTGHYLAKNEYVVEVAAKFRPFPKLMEKRIGSHAKLVTERHGTFEIPYLTKGTSLQETATEFGLRPNLVAKEIVMTFFNEVLPDKKFYKIMKTVPKVRMAPKQWEARNKRRAHLLGLTRKRFAAKKPVHIK